MRMGRGNKGCEQTKKLSLEERRAKEAEKRRRLEEQELATTKRAMASAAVSYDPRTGAGMRELQLQNLGGAMRVQVGTYGGLFKTKAAATDVRLLACHMFDGLCCRAYEGLFPEPRFEASVQGGKLSGVPDSRADALMRVDEMKRAIGSEAFAILFHRIHMGMTLKAMEMAGLGDKRRLATLFMAAVDGAARFFRLTKASPLTASMDQFLDGRGF
jgi:hypothetical protein